MTGAESFTVGNCGKVCRRRTAFLGRPCDSDQLTSLFADRFDDVRVTMARSGNSVTTVKIEIALAFARIDPDSFTAFSGNGHFLVRSQLILIFGKHGFTRI